MNIWFITKYGKISDSKNISSRSFSLCQEINRLGHSCTLIMSDSTRNTNVPNIKKNFKLIHYHDIDVLWIKTYKYSKAKSFKRILSWLSFEKNLLKVDTSILKKPDIVIASSLSLLTIISAFIFKYRYNSKIIFEVRDIWPLTIIHNSDFNKYNPFILILKVIEYLGYKYSDAVVGTMPNLKDHVNSVLKYERQVYCIPMGISNELIKFSDVNQIPYFYDEYFKENKFVVTYCGSFGYDNALDYFFEVAEKFHKSHNRSIQFLAFGKGDLKDYYVDKYSHLNNLTFGENVDSGYVINILKQSSLLFFSAHPSLVLNYGQSFNKIIEYMYSARPIIAAFSGFKSMINEAQCGYFIDPSDIDQIYSKIMELYSSDGEFLDQLGQNGKEWLLENRKYKILAQNYISIMESL